VEEVEREVPASSGVPGEVPVHRADDLGVDRVVLWGQLYPQFPLLQLVLELRDGEREGEFEGTGRHYERVWAEIHREGRQGWLAGRH